MNRREASKKETRELILKAARRLFAQKGMEDCTIRDIAKAAGVSPASVVVHFQSKTALLEEALHQDIDHTLARLMASLPPDKGLLERLLHLFQGFFGLYDQNRSLYRALIRHTIFEPLKETPHITKLTDRYIQFLAGMLEAEKTRGLIKPEVDPAVAAGAIFSLYLGALTLLFRQPEMTVAMVSEVLAAMTGQYLEGIISSGDRD
jgi:AcrR family transcriptional regulator